MTNKTYINGTQIKEINGEFGSFFNMSINLEKIKEYANEKGFINMTISKRKEPSQYGDTHYATLNEYTPKPKQDDSEMPF